MHGRRDDGVEVLPVRGRADMERFIRLPHALFRGDPAWVPPLLAERRAALSARKNPWFKHGEAAFWIARRGGRDSVGCIVLGRGSDEAGIVAWLRAAAPVPGFVGFAVGRTTFWDALVGLRDGGLTREAAAATSTLTSTSSLTPCRH